MIYDPSNNKNFRNTVFVKFVNWLASWLPDKQYTAFLAGSFEYGMRAAARDEEEGRELPPDWRSK